ncbi:geranylgeranyl diphosphate synthase type II [Caldalkalibacillus uzonensis]|uniref:Geranylgeranyl diphosphate synthase type II n=1 Tax=Caldalkalibacillus uzonensis TaxID=353224 RepID=A0ABU0CMS1_9BACI|nr:farnesyl diphosphate synthase [Caldalkalibacillus uzonensis]MDQ0337723.1 geranylgeranyl diphosphate synthase type II [Caldalkalibacillus uzonensis]
MNQHLEHFLNTHKQQVEDALRHYIEQVEAPAQLKEAMAYSLLAGGKRIRPLFLLATIDALGGKVEQGLPAACALEMIHTYSLIHDDLPAMDDDDYRRGKLTNHKVFGEALAILAGDALLTHAFFVLADAAQSFKPEQQLMMIKELALRAGPAGMVGGQTADVLGEGARLSFDQLAYIHAHKTGDLLVCAVRLGCYVAGASEDQLVHLTRYAREVGLAFQIQDDILDEIGDEQKLGKQVGSDRGNQKSTYISLLGLEGAKQALSEHVALAKQAVQAAGVKPDLLLALADFMVSREY